LVAASTFLGGPFLNHPDKLELSWFAIVLASILAYGLSDYLKKGQRNIAAFCLTFSIGCTCILFVAWHFWPTPSGHTTVEISSPGFVTDQPLFPLRVGEEPHLHIGFTNIKDFDVLDPHMDGSIVIRPFSDMQNDSIMNDFLKTATFPLSFPDLPAHGTRMDYHTFVGHSLTNDEIQKLKNPQGDILCAVSALRWRDTTGHYETDACTCLLASDWINQQNTAWTFCPGNQERKLN
jgi:hypothetical protein